MGSIAMAEVRFSREMGITRNDFLRTLPAAVGGRSIALDGDRISIVEGDRHIAIDLSKERTRVLAALTIPTVRVHFTFVDYSAHEVDEFMRRFELSFRRGGG